MPVRSLLPLMVLKLIRTYYSVQKPLVPLLVLPLLRPKRPRRALRPQLQRPQLKHLQHPTPIQVLQQASLVFWDKWPLLLEASLSVARLLMVFLACSSVVRVLLWPSKLLRNLFNNKLRPWAARTKPRVGNFFEYFVCVNIKYFL